MRDEDWLNNWKQYLSLLRSETAWLIVPEWEPVPDTAGPSSASSRRQPSGRAPTRRRGCAWRSLKTTALKPSSTSGCGSGILSVAALLLGAARAVCCDIAPDAAVVCRDNAALNGLEPSLLEVYTGDILYGNTLDEAAGNRRFDIVFANIIADVIIPLAPRVGGLLAPGGVFICSGIIGGRQDEVRAALENSGLIIISARQSENWHMFAARAADGT